MTLFNYPVATVFLVKNTPKQMSNHV